MTASTLRAASGPTTGGAPVPAPSNALPFEPPMLSEPMFRNFFSTIVFATAPRAQHSAFEGVRVFVDRSIGYSGNATRYKDRPDAGERALIANCEVRLPETNEIVRQVRRRRSSLAPLTALQCGKCADYFTKLNYFRQNPEHASRVLVRRSLARRCLARSGGRGASQLVKNSEHVRLVDGKFELIIKLMCWCDREARATCGALTARAAQLPAPRRRAVQLLCRSHFRVRCRFGLPWLVASPCVANRLCRLSHRLFGGR